MGLAMSADESPPKSKARADREKRLAEALRANLRRRKGATTGDGTARANKSKPFQSDMAPDETEDGR
jgi:hypothetical protein